MKKLLSIAALAALVLTACSKDLQVQPVDKLTVEYGDKLDNSKLFNAKESDENVKVDKVNGFEEKKLGEQTLKVMFTDGDKTTEKEIKVIVKDTKKPEITLKKDKITITAGDKLTLKDNVKSVKDPVDGNLKYSDKELKKSGYYIDKGKMDTKKAGTYEVKVLAYDANGNAAEKSFKVIIKKKPVKKTTAAPSEHNATEESQSTNSVQQPQTTSPSGGSASNGSGASSTGSSSSNNNSGSQGSTAPSKPTKPVACPTGDDPSLPCDSILPGQAVGSDGVYYTSHDEAWDVGMALGEAGKIPGFDCATVEVNDGSKRWILLYHQ